MCMQMCVRVFVCVRAVCVHVVRAVCVHVVRAVCVHVVSTGWRRPIRCLKLQVIFRKRATNYRALLRKMTCKNKASYGFAPPCTSIFCAVCACADR